MSKLQMRRLRKACRGEIPHWINEIQVKVYILSSKVTFQEILLIRMCVTNEQEGWKLRNIKDKVATIALNAL